MSRFQLWTRRVVLLLGATVLLEAGSAQALIRGGGIRMGGGARVASRTAIGPAGGIYRSTSVAAGRYHRPGVYPGIGVYPGTAAGIARRSVVRTTARAAAYRTAYGTSYYYGPAAVTLPPACFSTYWEGIAAYSCGGIMYVYNGGSYYPIEGI